MFSVIIPVYNKELYVKRALDSVLNQTCQDFEVIIVDDASIDTSIDIVNQYKDSRIRVYVRDKPGPGGYAARNLGIQEARGEWIAFLDADDEFHPDHLKETANVIGNNPDINITSSARISKYKEKKILDPFAKQNSFMSIFTITYLQYLQYCTNSKRPNGTNSICLRKSILGTSKVFPERKTSRSGDLYAWVHLMAKHGPMLWSSHISSYSYRDSGNMVSKTASANAKLFNKMVYELKDISTKKEVVWLERYANRLIRTAWFETKKMKVAQESFRKLVFWRHDILFCFVWYCLTLLPSWALESLKQFHLYLKLRSQ